MGAVTRSLRTHWDAMLAVLLAYTAITLYLGAQGFFLAWFLHGCGYIIHVALRR